MSTRFFNRLDRAIRAGNLKNLEKILAQEGQTDVSRDAGIRDAMYTAAVVGSVGACRILWQRLCRTGQEHYFQANMNNRSHGALHCKYRT
jgi:hypothetical protein